MARAVLVNGELDIFDKIEELTSFYDEIIVTSTADAYRTIKYAQPDLAVICLDLESRDGFLLLEMLKTDAVTRDIPILTLMSEDDGESEDGVSEVIFEEGRDFFERDKPDLPTS